MSVVPATAIVARPMVLRDATMKRLKPVFVLRIPSAAKITGTVPALMKLKI
jgi:Tfp pilus assembly protein FimV